MSLGTRVILLYLVIGYLIPGIGQSIFGLESAIYRSPELSFVQLTYGGLAFFVVIASAWDRQAQWDSHIGAIRPPHFRLQLFILLGILVIAAFGFGEGMSRWRYSSTGLSENISLMTLAYVLAPSVLEFMLLLEIFFFEENPAKRAQRRTVCILIALGFILTTSGIGPALLSAIAFLYALFPSQFRLMMFRNYRPSNGETAATKFGIIPLATAGTLAVFVAVIFGDTIKTGGDRDAVTYYWADLTVYEYIAYLIERFSTALISMRAALAEYTTLSWGDVSGNLWAPVSNLLFRIDSLVGGVMGILRPYAGSIMRLNYELININPINQREGTSPGLIGGFLMAFPLPWSLLALGTYTVLIRSMLNNMSRGFVGALTPIGTLAVLYFVFSIFSSPIDYLLIFDNGFLVFLAYLSLALIVRSKTQRRLRCD